MVVRSWGDNHDVPDSIGRHMETHPIRLAQRKHLALSIMFPAPQCCPPVRLEHKTNHPSWQLPSLRLKTFWSTTCPRTRFSERASSQHAFARVRQFNLMPACRKHRAREHPKPINEGRGGKASIRSTILLMHYSNHGPIVVLAVLSSSPTTTNITGTK